MCKAFSCLVLKSGETKWQFGIDSHSQLVEKFRLRDDTADPNDLEFAKVEITPQNGNYFHPKKWIFRIDEATTPTWWTPLDEKAAWKAHATWKRQLNKILVRKEIIDPFAIRPPRKVTKKHIKALTEWASVWASVQGDLESTHRPTRLLTEWTSVWASPQNSVGNSVRDSMRHSVGNSVWASVWASVQDSVGNSVRDSMRHSMGASVRDSMWASVRDSMWAYSGSFFKLPRKAWKYTEKISGDHYPFESSVYLWENGLVPSFDGKKWRLHTGKNAKVIWEGEI